MSRVQVQVQDTATALSDFREEFLVIRYDSDSNNLRVQVAQNHRCLSTKQILY
jgi:hypothetical protein